MDVIDIENLRKRAQRTKTKMATSHILYGKTRHSEVNHLTVTRIAGSQSEFYKRVNIYRTDMCLTIKNIKRQQYQLRRSMAHYSRKLRQSKIDRENRKQQTRKKVQEPEIPPLAPIHEECDTQPDPPDENTPEANNCNETGDIQTSETEDLDADIQVEDTQQTNSLTPIPEVDAMNVQQVDIESLITESEQCPMMILTENLQKGTDYEPITFPDNQTSMNDFDIKLYSQKKRKRQKPAVSYSDLVKLHHSTNTRNTRKLFNLVDKLSKRHEVAEPVDRSITSKHEPVRRNSLYYTINYGYDIPEDDQEQVTPPRHITETEIENENNLVEETEPALPDNRIFSTADNKFWREIHQARKSGESSLTKQMEDLSPRVESKAERRRRRATDLPLLVADYSDIRNKTLTLTPVDKKTCVKVHSSSSSKRFRHPTHLPPLSKEVPLHYP